LIEIKQQRYPYRILTPLQGSGIHRELSKGTHSVDDGPVAARAAHTGAEFARSLGAEVALIHAIDPALGYAPESGSSPAVLIARAERDGKKLLARFRRQMSLPSSSPAFAQVGNPATEIVKCAQYWPADLIVIGSHGREGVRRALLGSVAEAVIRHTPCPVLVIRAAE